MDSIINGYKIKDATVEPIDFGLGRASRRGTYKGMEGKWLYNAIFIPDYCHGCIYSGDYTKFDRDVGCCYILRTGEPRGCKPGDGCNKKKMEE